jgi:hypothetical protein
MRKLNSKDKAYIVWIVLLVIGFAAGFSYGSAMCI